ncbi:MAG TPA: TolC family protein [Nevskiaceae bacterium]|nr:TolC family protein [Nevskiaceae bacterium]
MPRAVPAGTALLALALAGCASLPADRGWSELNRLAAERGLTLPASAPEALVPPRVIEQPIDREEAIRLALAYNPDLQALAAELGFAAAELLGAARPANPRLSLARLSSSEPGALGAELSVGLAVEIVDLLLLPARRRLGQAQFDLTRQRLTHAAQTLAAETESAWLEHAAAVQAAELKARIADAEQAASQLMDRFRSAGNMTAREQAEQRLSSAEAQLEAVEAAAAREATRLQLARRMGLPADARWQLREGLPGLGDRPAPLERLLRLARERRLDLLAAEAEAQTLAQTHRLTRRVRLLPELELEYEWTRETDRSRLQGPGLSLPLPLFDGGGARVARAQAELDLAEARLAGLLLDIDREITEAHAELGAARARAEQLRDTLLPAHGVVVDALQREVNFMLEGVFTLVEARVAQYHAELDYREALRDHALASVRLALAVGTKLRAAPGAPVDLPAWPAAGAGGHDHHGHHGHHAAPAGAAPATPAPAADPAPASADRHHGHHGHQGHHGQPGAGSGDHPPTAPPAAVPAADPHAAHRPAAAPASATEPTP